ncbi:hypothetical protein TWF225_006136 [Orbilia oligospora]|uniref:Uncharacterized protein n=1 Tax=Orbilia oligospora TaxID=2813651 RepID=A0A7C8TRJ1_ORBOL|nr:hypothetical protein TWF751_002326 [Orbilia oligospora]KAF3183662.1 hypothetical protein TWF225_006136 [Orbilia oligospora]KAF3247535.1 hypothetical protein TWF128_008611 [Orbilia oligospora]KAF3250834.1 hypothetical protein TWF217_008447 [Orbilia oligospora]KAF3280665.1 hypothetical protein TWF132_011488 [Orbilia oligospora]
MSNYSPRRPDVSIQSTLKAATISPGRARHSRRPALIPAAAFNALESTADLSSILPDLHGLHNGGSVYILPPAPPPPELLLKMKLEQQQQQQQHLQPRPVALRRDPSSSSLSTDASDVDIEGDWDMSGTETPVQQPALPGSRTKVSNTMRRWSMKDLVDMDHKGDEEVFETPKQYIHKRQTSTVSQDLFSWVNSSTDAESGVRMVDIGSRVIKDLDSLPTSPMSSTAQPDIQRQLERLQEASRILHGL